MPDHALPMVTPHSEAFRDNPLAQSLPSHLRSPLIRRPSATTSLDIGCYAALRSPLIRRPSATHGYPAVRVGTLDPTVTPHSEAFRDGCPPWQEWDRPYGHPSFGGLPRPHQGKQMFRRRNPRRNRKKTVRHRVLRT
jgi:hypothetical protein